MKQLPEIAILLLTYKRTNEALRTLKSICENLQYPKELRHFYIADDGSSENHFQSLVSFLSEKEESIIGSHNKKIRHEGQEDTHNAGIGWNKGLGICYQKTDFVIVCEDDWELDENFDLIPYVKLLQEREDVGVCSFRILSVGADVHTVGHDGRLYLRYDRTTQYAYSGNPYLRHARYTRRYGWFAEDRNPGLIELEQDDRYRLAVGDDIESPRIWRPFGIDQWGAFKHIGQEKTWK